MALLDKANTSSYGNPEITKVNIGVRKRPGILISGHDLKDLEELLVQSEGKGVDIYTHSEMLPAQSYPFFKKFEHFAGNYGNAWWKQIDEFETFNGMFLFTSNCIVPPRPKTTYTDRVYTTGVVGMPDTHHIPEGPDGKKDFSEIIARAQTCEPPTEIEHGEIVAGFAHNQVLALAPKVIELIKAGKIRKFVVMANLRRSIPIPKILYGFCGTSSEGLRDPYGGMRKISLQQASFGRYRRSAACAGCRAMQRFLLACGDRFGAERCVWIEERQRPADCLQYSVV